MHKISVLLAGLLCATAVSADPLDDAIALFKRQSVNLSTGVSSSDSDITTPTPTPSSDDNPSTPTPTPSSSESVSTPPVVTESSTITPPTTATPTTIVVVSTSTRTPTNSAGSVTTTEVQTSTVSTVTQSASVSRTLITTSSVQEYTTIITSVSDGSTLQFTSTSSSFVPVTTSVDPASLTGNSGGKNNSGLSDSSKKTIGGVVGGIGGALLLAGLAYTAWRIWGKKKNLHDDDLYDPNIQDKNSATTASDQTPFRSTLDQYHSPGPVNTASNF